MEGYNQNKSDQLFEDDLIRMCIEQLLDDEDDMETMSADAIFTQQSSNLHFSAQNYQVIGEQPLRNGVVGGKKTFSNTIRGNFQRNSATSKLNPNAKVFVPQGYAVRSSS